MQTRIRRPLPIHLSLLLVSLLAIFAYARAYAQTPPPGQVTDDRVNAVARQLYCPVCENIPLDVCPTQACGEWRELIRQKLAEGWNTEQIKQYFAEQYGDRVLASPPRSGFNWLIYIIPPLAILAGAFILFRALRSWTRPSASPIPPITLASQDRDEQSTHDEYFARLEEELKNR